MILSPQAATNWSLDGLLVCTERLVIALCRWSMRSSLSMSNRNHQIFGPFVRSLLVQKTYCLEVIPNGGTSCHWPAIHVLVCSDWVQRRRLCRSSQSRWLIALGEDSLPKEFGSEEICFWMMIHGWYQGHIWVAVDHQLWNHQQTLTMNDHYAFATPESMINFQPGTHQSSTIQWPFTAIKSPMAQVVWFDVRFGESVRASWPLVLGAGKGAVLGWLVASLMSMRKSWRFQTSIGEDYLTNLIICGVTSHPPVVCLKVGADGDINVTKCWQRLDWVVWWVLVFTTCNYHYMCMCQISGTPRTNGHWSSS